MHTNIPITEIPNSARRQEYKTPWTTSQLGVAAKTYCKAEKEEGKTVVQLCKPRWYIQTLKYCICVTLNCIPLAIFNF